MTPMVLLLSLACGSGAPPGQPPPALPPPVLPAVTVQARMVAMGEVRGLLARPPTGEDHPAILLRVDGLDEAARDAVTAEAARGRVALAIAGDTDPGAARAYLAGMPDVVGPVIEQCRRRDCGEAAAPPPSLDPDAPR